ncbi:MAG: hypothetical protein K9K67_07820 [Bacteriovoracaceae bacterium]|nr:hypothetical protein [Bacteriovoracaceae bacterium]
MLRSVVLLTLALVLGSCSSINKSHMNASIGISISSPMDAKIDVDMTKKLVGYASGGYLFHLLKVSGDSKYIDGVSYNSPGGNDDGFLTGVLKSFSKIEEVKAAAAYNAIRTSDADVLINPQYIVEESNWNPFYKLIKVKVTGFPGKVISIKNQR